LAKPLPAGGLSWPPGASRRCRYLQAACHGPPGASPRCRYLRAGCHGPPGASRRCRYLRTACHAPPGASRQCRYLRAACHSPPGACWRSRCLRAVCHGPQGPLGDAAACGWLVMPPRGLPGTARYLPVPQVPLLRSPRCRSPICRSPSLPFPQLLPFTASSYRSLLPAATTFGSPFCCSLLSTSSALPPAIRTCEVQGDACAVQAWHVE
jgi:hypothetical protein